MAISRSLYLLLLPPEHCDVVDDVLGEVDAAGALVQRGEGRAPLQTVLTAAAEGGGERSGLRYRFVLKS